MKIREAADRCLEYQHIICKVSVLSRCLPVPVGGNLLTINASAGYMSPSILYCLCNHGEGENDAKPVSCLCCYGFTSSKSVYPTAQTKSPGGIGSSGAFMSIIRSSLFSGISTAKGRTIT